MIPLAEYADIQQKERFPFAPGRYRQHTLPAALAGGKSKVIK